MHAPGLFGILIGLALVVGTAFAVRAVYRWVVSPNARR